MSGAFAIYPAWRGIGLMVAGAPLSVLLALTLSAGLWRLSLVWIAAVAVLILLDAWLGPSRRSFQIALSMPDRLEAGRGGGTFEADFSGRLPDQIELVLEADEFLSAEPERLTLARGGDAARFRLVPRRRGRSLVANLHMRWQGPLRLVWKQSIFAIGKTIDIVPNISAVREEAIRLFSRTLEGGTAIQRDQAPSMEFHALREFQTGDDRRSVNWRQSARHRKLLVRETHAERNRSIVFAFDTGRLMCEPLDGGLPRIDHAINAALLMAYAALKAGDRAGFFAFDAQPGLSSGLAAGVDAFAPLQRLAAGLDYSMEETNFTLGLTRLAATLRARALIVVFTEFADSTGAMLMIDNIGRLLERHLVLFVSFRDTELEAMAEAEPAGGTSVSRAVVAGGLLRERDIVLGRLRRQGVEVLDVLAEAAGPALLRRYFALKREDRL